MKTLILFSLSPKEKNEKYEIAPFSFRSLRPLGDFAISQSLDLQNFPLYSINLFKIRRDVSNVGPHHLFSRYHRVKS